MKPNKQNAQYKADRYTHVRAAAIKAAILTEEARAEVRQAILLHAVKLQKSERGQAGLIGLVALAIVVLAAVLILGPVLTDLWQSVIDPGIAQLDQVGR